MHSNNNPQKDHILTMPIPQNNGHRVHIVYDSAGPIRQLDDSYIICGKAEEVLELLPEKSFQCCVTSPPYWSLRDYRVNGQLGSEERFDDYIERLMKIPPVAGGDAVGNAGGAVS